jgi:hypothetical protein
LGHCDQANNKPRQDSPQRAKQHYSNHFRDSQAASPFFCSNHAPPILPNSNQ